MIQYTHFSWSTHRYSSCRNLSRERIISFSIGIACYHCKFASLAFIRKVRSEAPIESKAAGTNSKERLVHKMLPGIPIASKRVFILVTVLCGCNHNDQTNKSKLSERTSHLLTLLLYYYLACLCPSLLSVSISASLCLHQPIPGTPNSLAINF